MKTEKNWSQFQLPDLIRLTLNQSTLSTNTCMRNIPDYGTRWGIPTASMRMFNVYGTRQALSDPYTGVVTKFATQLINQQQPSVFEDGGQLRNFVHVKDVVRAYAAFLKSDAQVYESYNVGSDEDHHNPRPSAPYCSDHGQRHGAKSYAGIPQGRYTSLLSRFDEGEIGFELETLSQYAERTARGD